MTIEPAAFRAPVASGADRLPFRSVLNPRSRHSLDHRARVRRGGWFAEAGSPARTMPTLARRDRDSLHDAHPRAPARATRRVQRHRPRRAVAQHRREHRHVERRRRVDGAAGHVWIGVTTSAGTFAEARLRDERRGDTPEARRSRPLRRAQPPRVRRPATSCAGRGARRHGRVAPRSRRGHRARRRRHSPASSRRSGRPTRALAAFPSNACTPPAGRRPAISGHASCNGATTRRWLDGCAMPRPSTAS